MASSPEPTVRVVEDGPVMRIMFDRPHALNSVNLEMATRLAAIADTIAGWPSRAIVLQGAGGNFMAGGDVFEMAGAERPAAMVDDLVRLVHHFSLALATTPIPVIALVEGAAAGYGLSLAISCDFTICADDVHLAMAYSRLGVACDGGPSFLLPRIVGAQRTMALMLLSDRIDPHEAVQLGLFHAAVPAAKLSEACNDLLARLLANSQAANASVKKLVRADIAGFAAALEAERKEFTRIAASDDFREGLNAFLDRRRPDFLSKCQTL